MRRVLGGHCAQPVLRGGLLQPLLGLVQRVHHNARVLAGADLAGRVAGRQAGQVGARLGYGGHGGEQVLARIQLKVLGQLLWVVLFDARLDDALFPQVAIYLVSKEC